MKTYGDLIEKLIEHYKMCLEKYPYDGTDSAKILFLQTNGVEYGICYCSRYIFDLPLNINQRLVDIVEEMCGGSMYITSCPSPYSESWAVKRTFEIRIEKMEEFKHAFSQIKIIK
jgi:hypothetical protein